MRLPCNSDDFIVQLRAETELLEAAMFRIECLTEHYPRSDWFYHSDRKSRPSVRHPSVLEKFDKRAEPDGRPKRIAAVKTVQVDRRKCNTLSRSCALKLGITPIVVECHCKILQKRDFT